MRLFPMTLLAALMLPMTAHAGDVCLRGDNLDHITMTGPLQATATDKSGRKYDITFVAPCGARNQNVYFVTNPDKLQTCLTPGVALPTNLQAACVVKSVTLSRTGS
jgi:hypothetical protein